MVGSLGEKIKVEGGRRGGFYTPSPNLPFGHGGPRAPGVVRDQPPRTGHPGVQDPGHPEWSETFSMGPGHPGDQDPKHPEWSETIHPRPGTRGSRTPGTRGGQGGLGLLPD